MQVGNLKLPAITSGIWQITQVHGCDHDVLLSRQPDSSGLVIARIMPGRNADARAIVMLPELLEALNEARTELEKYASLHSGALPLRQCLDRTRAALIKAGATELTSKGAA